MNRYRTEYVPDYRLTGAYEEAIRRDDTDDDTVCPTWQDLRTTHPLSPPLARH